MDPAKVQRLRDFLFNKQIVLAARNSDATCPFEEDIRPILAPPYKLSNLPQNAVELRLQIVRKQMNLDDGDRLELYILIMPGSAVTKGCKKYQI